MKKKIFLIVILISIIFSQKYFAQNANWKKIDALAGKKITKLVFDKNGYLFVGADSLGIYYSTKSGYSFVKINLPAQLISINYWLRDIKFSDANRLFISLDGSSRSFWHTSDLGSTWNKVDSIRYPVHTVYSAAFDTLNTVIVGTNYGIYQSSNLGVNWSYIGGIPNAFGVVVAVNDLNNLFAGVQDYHFYRATNIWVDWTQISHYSQPYYFVPVNSAFPPMPNPGLKPNEAEAVAKYILEEYKK